MSKKRKIAIALVILLGLCLLISCFVFFGLVIAGSSDKSLSSDTFQEGTSDGSIAIIDINGVITDTGSSDFFGNEFASMADEAIGKIRNAADDESIKGVIFRIDSPGGEVYATKLIYDEIVKLHEKKPVVVMMGGTAASGAYYISAPADYIVASPITITGSIGVILNQYDLSGLYDKVGVKEIVVTNTKGKFKVYKDLGNEKSESYKLFQGLLDDVYADFSGVVQKGRGYTDAEIAKIADGRVYSGKQAVANRLVDTLGGFEEASAKIESLTGLSDPTYILLKEDEGNFSPYGFSLRSLIMGKQDVLDKVEEGPRLYYIVR